jgi:hypothetical protein
VTAGAQPAERPLATLAAEFPDWEITSHPGGLDICTAYWCSPDGRHRRYITAWTAADLLGALRSIRATETGGAERWRRRTGIEPAGDASRRPPVLKTGGATRHPDASGADVTGAPPAPAIGPAAS